ncbi:MAG: cytochrome c3 family protein [Phycisphaeraceae bacterium]
MTTASHQPRSGSLGTWRTVLWVAGIVAFVLVVFLLTRMLSRGPAGDQAAPVPSRSGADSMARYTRDTAFSARVEQVIVLPPPAPRPSGALPADASCVTPECHGQFTVARVVHGPVAVQACSTCHESDQGEHTYPLKKPNDGVCQTCHDVTGTRSHEHKAVSVNGCLACHDPHISATKHLLKADSVGQLCQKCHIMPLEKYAHTPFIAGQCTACHNPHQADNAKLLRGGDGPEHCFACHDQIKLRLANSPATHDPAKKDCLTCHAAHTSANPHQLKADVTQTCLSCHEQIARTIEGATVSHDAMFMKESCANCHEPHAGETRVLLRDRQDKLCLTCHDQELKTSDGRMIASMKPTLARKFLHGPIRSGDCSSCHNVHGATQANLLREKFPKTFYASFDLGNYALCFGCHSQDLVLLEKTKSLTGFRDGDRNLHYAHVHRDEKGRTCKTCHSLHGSDQPNHMAQDVPFEGSQWAMPIRFEKADDGGRCAPGCHEAKAYSRTPEAKNEVRGTKNEQTVPATQPAADDLRGVP